MRTLVPWRNLQRSRQKKLGRKRFYLLRKKNPEYDVDILGMAREINLHSLEESKNLESGNGREFTTEEINGGINGEKASTSQKVKRKRIIDPIHLTVQKRKRSSLGHVVHKSSHSGSSLMGVRKAFEDHSHHEKTPSFDLEMGNKKHANSTDLKKRENLWKQICWRHVCLPEIEMSNEYMTADEDDSLIPKSTPVS
ncbi:hypothetical protein Sjap_000530 [Stephania japonica]|uniref:Uncharacterized protein n=1 Tax=Stephania japonica TaxID=461633 RepID=A0AAP0KJ77_9MAGN